MALQESMLGTALCFLKQGTAIIFHVYKVPRRMQARPLTLTVHPTAVQLIVTHEANILR